MNDDLPKIYLPKNLNSASINPTAPSNDVQIANNTLRDVNEVLKTVNSIASNLGFNIPDMIKKAQEKNQPKEQQQVTKYLDSPPETYQQQKQEVQKEAPVPVQQSQPKLILRSKEATDELIARIKEIKDDTNIKEFKEQVIGLHEMGFLEPQVKKIMEKYIEVQL